MHSRHHEIQLNVYIRCSAAQQDPSAINGMTFSFSCVYLHFMYGNCRQLFAMQLHQRNSRAQYVTVTVRTRYN